MKYLTKKEVKKFMGVVSDDTDKLILSLMLYEGMRIGEVVGDSYNYWKYNGHVVSKKRIPEGVRKELKDGGESGDYAHVINSTPPLTVENIDVENKTIQVTGKGNKTRYIPVADPVMLMLLQYIRTQNIETGPLFSITSQSVRARMKMYAEKAEIRHIHPHMLRHTFSYNYIKNGGEIRSLQKILGHSSLATTAKYLDWVLGDVKDDFYKTMTAAMEQTRDKEEVARIVAKSVINELF